MRIAHAIFSTSFAGSERIAIELANALSARHDVYFFLPASLRLRDPHGLLSRLSPAVEPRFIGLFGETAGSAIRKCNPDVVHCHLSSAARRISRLRRRPPVVATLHFRYDQSYRNCDGLIRVAEWQKEGMEAVGVPSVTVSNWTLAGDPLSLDARAGLRRSLGADNDTRVLLAVGRLERQKRFDVLIEAFNAAAEGQPRVQLWIAGDGDKRRSLERLAGANVRLLGFRNDVPRLLRCADLYIQSSRFEACPLSVLEAMDASLPVLATDLPGNRELLGDSALAYVPAEDTAALALALKRVLRDGWQVPQYDMSGYRLATQAGRVEAFYEQILSGRRRQ